MERKLLQDRREAKLPSEAPEFDPYAVLGIQRNATPEEIEAAWRRALKASHPDRHPGGARNAQRIRDVLRAGRMLRDPTRRAAQDRANGGQRSGIDREARPTWMGLSWDGAGSRPEPVPTPGGVDIVHRKD